MISDEIVNLELFADDFERYEAFCRKNSLSLFDGVARLLDLADVPSAEKILVDMEMEKLQLGMTAEVYAADVISRAKSGDSSAQAELAGMYFIGRGVSQDYTQAAFWAEKAAACGECTAEILLGILYFYGDAVPQDFSKAQELLRNVSECGNPMYMVMAGLACLNSVSGDALLDVPFSDVPEFQEAFSWFEKAAKLRSAWGEFMLGVCYDEGMGVEKDEEYGEVLMSRGAIRDKSLNEWWENEKGTFENDDSV